MNTVNLAGIRERVAAGAELLDRTRPGWWQRVDTDRLNLNSDTDDVLGQEYGSYAEAVNGPVDLASAYDHGFAVIDTRTLDDPDLDLFEFDAVGECEALTAEWRRVIADRRVAKDAGIPETTVERLITGGGA